MDKERTNIMRIIDNRYLPEVTGDDKPVIDELGPWTQLILGVIALLVMALAAWLVFGALVTP